MLYNMNPFFYARENYQNRDSNHKLIDSKLYVNGTVTWVHSYFTFHLMHLGEEVFKIEKPDIYFIVFTRSDQPGSKCLVRVNTKSSVAW
jgi:hypothetical protein